MRSAACIRRRAREGTSPADFQVKNVPLPRRVRRNSAAVVQTRQAQIAGPRTPWTRARRGLAHAVGSRTPWARAHRGPDACKVQAKQTLNTREHVANTLKLT